MRYFIVLASLATVLFAAVPSQAASLYTIAFQSGNGPENSVSSTTPFGRDSLFALVPSNGDAFATVHGVAVPGRAGAGTIVEANWASGLSGAFSAHTRSTTLADDFLITGPVGGTVTATLNLRLTADLSLAGGFVGNGGHGASVQITADVRGSFYPNPSYAFVDGIYSYTNAGPFSSGWLAGVQGPSINYSFPVTATLPVNAPFTVRLVLHTSAGAYGNVFVNPGFSASDAGGDPTGPIGGGFMLESINGQVITLPAGYTVTSPSWGIVNNGSPLVGVESSPLPPGALRLRMSGSNPFGGAASLTMYLPRGSHARVSVFDVAGRLVRTLAQGWHEAGQRNFSWDGKAEDGAETPTGIYFVHAESGEARETVRLVRVR